MISNDAELSVYAAQELCGGENYILLSYENKNPTMQAFKYEISYNAPGVKFNEEQKITSLAANGRFDITCGYVLNHCPYGIIKLPLGHTMDLSQLDIRIKR